MEEVCWCWWSLLLEMGEISGCAQLESLFSSHTTIISASRAVLLLQSVGRCSSQLRVRQWSSHDTVLQLTTLHSFDRSKI